MYPRRFDDNAKCLDRNTGSRTTTRSWDYLHGLIGIDDGWQPVFRRPSCVNRRRSSFGDGYSPKMNWCSRKGNRWNPRHQAPSLTSHNECNLYWPVVVVQADPGEWTKPSSVYLSGTGSHHVDAKCIVRNFRIITGILRSRQAENDAATYLRFSAHTQLFRITPKGWHPRRYRRLQAILHGNNCQIS